MLFSTSTAGDGSFLLDDSRMKYFWSADERKVLFVARKAYDISVTILEHGQTNVEVVLRPTTIETPSVPDCTREVPKGLNARGRFVRIEFPRNMKLKKHSNFEYSGFRLTAKEKTTEAVLHNWIGVYSTTYPASHLIINSKIFIVTHTSLGLDWKGQRTDGTYWRYIGGASRMIDSFAYETTSETLAKQFDQVLATMCVRK